MASSSTPALQKPMALLLLLSLFSVAVALPPGGFYYVGGKRGWKVHGNYNRWAANKKFHAGDALLFKYDNQYENLLMVERKEYWNCDPKSPIWTYNTGHDIVLLKRPAQLYFISSNPAHCKHGQRVWIKVD